jgi:ribonuclease D
MENLILPELMRRLCWDWEVISANAQDPAKAVDEYLRLGQARAWQRELVVPVLAAALTQAPDAEIDP